MKKLNKKPYTKEELDAIVLRTENRLGASLFFHPVVKTVEPVIAYKSVAINAVVVEQVSVKSVDNVIIHTNECRCDQCIMAKLDSMLAKSEITLSNMKVAFKQTDEIEYVN